MPIVDPISRAAGGTSGQAYEAFTSKYATAGSWAIWASTLLERNIDELKSTHASFDVTDLLTNAMATILAIPNYTPGTIATYAAPDVPTYGIVPAYVAPAKPTLATVPTYTAPTLGAMNTTLPTLHDITIPAAPSATITYTKVDFSHDFHTAILAKLTDALANGGTGLGATVEAAMFARETARLNSQRAVAYTELTTQFSKRGFPQPPGALLAKQTEVNNESSLRLTDSSTGILEQSAKLAQQYTLAAMELSVQLDNALVNVWNSQEERAFNKAKADVDAAVTVFAETVKGAIGVAQLDVAKLQAFVATNDATAKIYELQVNAQIEPMKALTSLNSALVGQFTAEVQAATTPITAIASSNASQAEAYKAAVAGAASSVTASIGVEEANAKAYSMNLQKTTAVAELSVKQAQAAIEAAVRQYATDVAALQGTSQAAAQMVASALNSVNVSSSFNWGESMSYSITEDANATLKDNVHVSSVV